MTRYALILSLLLAAAGCTTSQPLIGTAPRPVSAPRAPGPRPSEPRTSQTEPARTAPLPRQGVGSPESIAEAEPPAPELPAETAPRVAPASVALLQQSRDQRAAGSYAAAASSIERALRIEPNNAELWLELAEIKLDDANPLQAEQMARKALTLASGDPVMASRAERLLALAASCARGGC